VLITIGTKNHARRCVGTWNRRYLEEMRRYLEPCKGMPPYNCGFYAARIDQWLKWDGRISKRALGSRGQEDCIVCFEKGSLRLLCCGVVP
jgi:hypothetical protein